MHNDETQSFLADETGQPSNAWLNEQALRLFNFFGPAALNPKGGFWALGRTGEPLRPACAVQEVQPLHNATRFVHCYSWAHRFGFAGAQRMIDQGLEFIWKQHRDAQHGGYYWAVSNDGVIDPAKQAYGHAFVLLAAAAAKAVMHPFADRLLDDIVEVIEQRFWEPERGASREEFSADWQVLSTYRGQNSNMHLTEALIAAFAVTEDRVFLQKAEEIAHLIIDRHARSAQWRVPEHFDANWQVDLEYSGDPMFRPAGTTPGHALEWSRLLIELYQAGEKRHAWLVEAAEQLFLNVCQTGWCRERGGFYYTLDWQNMPLQRKCLWWPCAEGIAAAATLQQVSDRPEYAQWYRRIWQFSATHLIDHMRGGWFAELDQNLRPDETIFEGKPDLYHAVQACLISLQSGAKESL